MSKRKLSQQQKRIIEQKQASILQSHTEESENNIAGLLVTQFGTYADVEISSDQIVRCNLRQNLLKPVVGDEVIVQLKKADEGVIVAVKPRYSSLHRIDPRGQTKVIAANVDQIMVVIAVKPEFSLFLLDCYLAAAATQHISTCIVLNKTDLITLDDTEKLEQLKYYQRIGYPFIFVNTVEQENLLQLYQALHQHCSVFVGQSGVGKSSLIQEFVSEEIDIGLISEQNQLGKHTTTTSRLYHLENGGSVIDSPGVRDFGLGKITKQQLIDGFIDIKEISLNCKFRNCMHQHEPNCAVKLAVNEGELLISRLESFHKLLEIAHDN